MAAKKKTAKKTANRGQNGGTATLEPGKAKGADVEQLPKGQTRAKDGTIILKNGMHEALPRATYIVHGSRIQLDGRVFVAQYDVNWIPVKQCVCKQDRPDPVEMRKLPDGRYAMLATCNNKKCEYAGARYLWIVPKDRFRL